MPLLLSCYGIRWLAIHEPGQLLLIPRMLLDSGDRLYGNLAASQIARQAQICELARMLSTL